MSYMIRKQFHFSAAHHLFNLPDDHPCTRIHGHNYIIELVLESNKLNSAGFVRDYHELDVFKKWIDEFIDHRDLNEVLPLSQTSAENIANYFYRQCKSKFGLDEIFMVRVSETPKTWAEYYE